MMMMLMMMMMIVISNDDELPISILSLHRRRLQLLCADARRRCSKNLARSSVRSCAAERAG